MGFLDHFRSIFSPPAGQRGTAPATEPDGTPNERRRRQRRNPREGTTILLIDDSPTILTALKRILRSAGCVTLEAPDAEQGLEMAARQPPHLIFLDIVLPGMNGFAALRQLRRDPATRNIPVIMMSGNEQATEQFFGTRIGADDFMKKPFSRFEVFARIERLLDEADVPRRLPPPEGPAPVSRRAALQSS